MALINGQRLNSARPIGKALRSRSYLASFLSGILPISKTIQRSHPVLTPPPSLTPMERQFLLQLQDLDQTMRIEMARQDKKITALEAQILLRDRSITGLTELLERLLGIAVPGASSQP
jgi:hypothetical protein